jgi:hypothetical protein
VSNAKVKFGWEEENEENEENENALCNQIIARKKKSCIFGHICW